MLLKFIPVFLLLGLAAQAQNTGKKLAFGSINQVGLLTGNNGEAFAVQSINGIKMSNWFAGIGVGFDFYKDKTVPLFLDVRLDLTKKLNTPFVYTDAGINILALTSAQKKLRDISSSSPGVFYDLGVGWKLKVGHERAILLSAGYSLKQVKHQTKTYWGAPTIQMQEENFDRYSFLYRRVIFKLGIQL